WRRKKSWTSCVDSPRSLGANRATCSISRRTLTRPYRRSLDGEPAEFAHARSIERGRPERAETHPAHSSSCGQVPMTKRKRASAMRLLQGDEKAPYSTRDGFGADVVSARSVGAMLQANLPATNRFPK